MNEPDKDDKALREVEHLKSSIKVGIVLAIIIGLIIFFFIQGSKHESQNQLYNSPDCAGGTEFCN